MCAVCVRRLPKEECEEGEKESTSTRQQRAEEIQSLDLHLLFERSLVDYVAEAMNVHTYSTRYSLWAIATEE